ncbi:ankyrin repeat domain-containing protein [bacterium]|nr:ankyrin repeat domain-containing protein [bacterium]
MKHLLITTIAAVVLVGCGELQQSAPSSETKPVVPVGEAAAPEPPTTKAPDIPIREAVIGGNIEAVKQHLDAGADVNAKGKYGRTPLHYAASRGLKKIIELLIARGADVNTKIEVGDYKGQTPLDGAIQWDRTETADLLRKHGGMRGRELKAEGR